MLRPREWILNIKLYWLKVERQLVYTEVHLPIYNRTIVFIIEVFKIGINYCIETKNINFKNINYLVIGKWYIFNIIMYKYSITIRQIYFITYWSFNNLLTTIIIIPVLFMCSLKPLYFRVKLRTTTCQAKPETWNECMCSRYLQITIMIGLLILIPHGNKLGPWYFNIKKY